MDFFTVNEFLKTVSDNEKTCFLLRHAERLHIKESDADYGAHVRITENGFKTAELAGKTLPNTGPANYISSPVMRCKETAAAIAKGYGDKDFDTPEKIRAISALGDFFVKNEQAYIKALEEGFYEAICEYLEKGVHRAFKDLEEGSLEMLSLLKTSATSKWNFALTHDAWIVPCLKYFCGITCTPSKWLNFISGIAFTFKENSFNAHAITFMDSGYLVFSGR